MTKATLQPGSTDGYDSCFDQTNATTNYGGAANIDIGKQSVNPSRGIIKFDLSSIPVQAVISAATVALTVSGTSATDRSSVLCAYRVLKNWVESQVTWNIYSTGNNWGSVGCSYEGVDRESSIFGSVSIAYPSAINTTYNMPVNAALVQEWTRGTVSNYGMLLKSNTETANDDILFYSSDSTATTYRPIMYLDYSIAGVSFQSFVIAG